MTRTKASLILAAAAAMLAACSPPAGNGPPPGAPGSKNAVDPKSIDSSYAAVAAGKVDIEGGLVDVAARAQGIVQEVFVQEGDRVKKDQILARQENENTMLSRNRVAAALAQSEAQIPVLQVQLDAAIREQKRLDKLIAEKATSQQSYDQAVDRVQQLQAQVEAQKAAVKLSRAQLAESNYQVEQSIVRAPANGVIVRRYANPGMGTSTLNVTPMFQLQPDAARIVRAELEESSLAKVKVGQKVQIEPEANPEAGFPGSVVRIAGVMGSRKLRSDDPSERADERVVEVVVDAAQANVLVGQRVLVKFLKDGEGAAITKDTEKTAEK